jgi:hypothetical protein
MADNMRIMTLVKHSETDSAIRRDAGADRKAGSFLVRVWYESRESAGREPQEPEEQLFRGYIRNLQTGEERFVRAPEKLSEHIAEQMEKGADGPRGWKRAL